jgi:excisionase family DNA binding protein
MADELIEKGATAVTGAAAPEGGKRRRGSPLPDESLRLVTLEVLCERLGLPKKWVRRLAGEGKLPCARVGQRLLFDVDRVASRVQSLALRNQYGQDCPYY